MASDLYNEETCSTEILNQAQEVLDFDLLETMFTDEEGKLGETENTQPALLTHSVALLEALQNLNADYTMGHSLGEYSSLVASGVLSYLKMRLRLFVNVDNLWLKHFLMV